MWYLNDTQHNNIITNLNAVRNFDPQLNLGSILFPQILGSLNDTRIKCVANFTSGNIIQSEDCQIIVQGL